MHKAVFADRAVEALALKKKDIVVDATFGEGGHSRNILPKIGPEGKLVAMDKDPAAIDRAGLLKSDFPNLIPVHSDFRRLDSILQKVGIKKVNAVLFDFGLSQGLLEESGRGFSFRRDEKLDMRMNPQDALTAREIVNQYPEEEIREIIDRFGEDYRAGKIARAVVRQRQVKPIETTLELAGLVMKVAKSKERHRRIHPATKTFQALRIAVNDELQAIQEGLEKAIECLCLGGRCVAISFHSLEDRIVKLLFREREKQGILRVITKKPWTTNEDERIENPRARSAKMRVAEKI